MKSAATTASGTAGASRTHPGEPGFSISTSQRLRDRPRRDHGIGGAGCTPDGPRPGIEAPAYISCERHPSVFDALHRGAGLIVPGRPRLSAGIDDVDLMA